MSDISQENTEPDKNVSFDVLFKENLNPEKILPVVRHCVSVSKNDCEIIRAVELALCACIRHTSFDDLESIFEFACPAAASLFESRVKLLEEQSNPIVAECIDSFNYCLRIVAYFQDAFEYLNQVEKITLSWVESLLKFSLDILLKCFHHCKGSEEVYGAVFDSLADSLSGFFKTCCGLLDALLDFLTEKSEVDLESDREISLLDKLLTKVSKCGIVMVSLEVKAMAKIWKTYIYLLEKYLYVLKTEHKIGGTISALCDVIVSNVEGFKDDDDNGKLVKLSCFLLKLIMKLCDIFKNQLSRCHGSLFNLLLILCKCDSSVGENKKENLTNQLTIGVDPLLSSVLADVDLIREFSNYRVVQSEEFCLLCCLVLKKLSRSSTDVRSLWINETDNIFDWLFNSASSCQFIGFSAIRLPNVNINWQRVTFTDLYEYVLVTASAFLLTASAVEFTLVEKTLMRNVLQPTLGPALLAADIWCFLARVADPDLCYDQILTLSEMYKRFQEQSERVEKCFLASLIRRLFVFLTDSRQKEYLKCFSPSFYSSVWYMRGIDCIPCDEVCDVIRPIVSRCGHLIRKTESRLVQTSNERENSLYLAFGAQIPDLWRFDCELLSYSPEFVKFMKIACGLAACIVPFAGPEDLLLVLSQMRKLLSVRMQPTVVKLYFLWILDALSPVTLPPGDGNQRKILLAVSEIFRELLSSGEMLAKHKALEIFESFTRVTSHEEVIAMTVQNFPELRMEISSHFKKRPADGPPEGFEEYLRALFEIKYEHVCEEKEPGPGLSLKRIKLDVPDMKGAVARFREDGDLILEYGHTLSEVQKREIKNLCSSILSNV